MLDILFSISDGGTNGRCAGTSNLCRISNLLSFLSFRVFFEVQTLLSNMAANSNGQNQRSTGKLPLVKLKQPLKGLFFISIARDLLYSKII